MIQLNNKRDCCGCRACEIKCPKSCIAMIEDFEGFLYPQIDKTLCINCRLCDKVCPVINRGSSIKPIEVLASINPSEQVRMNSSSGGVFTALAKRVIDDGGVVFGVSWSSKWMVEHTYVETVEELSKFRGSKYLQSDTNNSFLKVEDFLKNGRKVLFSGTPCQIAGLNKFLRKEYDNLLTVEVVCHGVPSPKIWRDYLAYLLQTNNAIANSEITAILFRDKVVGWNRSSLTILTNVDGAKTPIFSETLDKNLYMQGFLKDFYLRPSCHKCPAKSGKSGADIGIADYWGVHKFHPTIDCNKGVGLTLLYTLKGKDLYNELELNNTLSNFEYAIINNPCIVRSVNESKLRAYFWEQYKTIGIGAINRTLIKMRPHIFNRIVNKFKYIVSGILRRLKLKK